MTLEQWKLNSDANRFAQAKYQINRGDIYMLEDTGNNYSHWLKRENELNIKSNFVFLLYNEMPFYPLNFPSVELRKVSPAFFKYLLMMICELN